MRTRLTVLLRDMAAALHPAAYLTAIALAIPACAFFPGGERSRVPVPEMETRLGDVRYELINWGRRPRQGQTLASVLETSARFRAISRGPGGPDWAVQIVLEPYPGEKELGARFLERPFRFMLNFVNNTLAGNSGLVIPVVNRAERRVIFIVRRRGEFRKKYVYRSDAWVVFGWVSILLWPASEAKYLRYDMARIARLFLNDAVRDGLLKDGGDE